MKKLLLSRRSIAVISGVLLLALLGWGVERWLDGRSYPDFPVVEGDEPQVLLSYKPDFAYHIGDVVPVTVYIRQKPGTKVDIEQLAFKGQFEMRGAPEMSQHKFRDGSVCYRIKLSLQSVEAEAKRSLTGECSWYSEKTKEGKDLKLPPITIYGSNTWDGRNELQNGDLQPTPLWMLFVKSIGALVLSSVILCWIGYRSYKTWRAGHILTAEQLMVRHLEKLWARIEGGDNTPANYAEIERFVRQRWAIESVSSEELTKKLSKSEQYLHRMLYHVPQHLDAMQEFLTHSGMAIYSEERPDAADNKTLRALCFKLVQLSFIYERVGEEEAAEVQGAEHAE